MNTSIQTVPTAETSQETGLRPEALQAIQLIHQELDTWDAEAEVELTPTSATFPVLYGRCTISASPLNIDTYDGLRLTEQLQARTELSYVIDDFDDGFFTLANEYATTGAALRCPETGRAVLLSRVSVFEDDSDALLNFYTPMLYWSSLVQSFSIQQAMRKRFEIDFLGEKSEIIGTPGCDDPSRWQAEEFALAEEKLRAIGVYCNASESGLTAEFPWEPGAVSAMTGDQTSLLQMDNTVTHPTAGNGLVFRLVLPVSGNTEELVVHANKLNLLEIDGIDIPPGFGAWSVIPRFQGVGYTGFWPNCIYRRGTAASIAGWCLLRSRIAQRVFSNAC